VFTTILKKYSIFTKNGQLPINSPTNRCRLTSSPLPVCLIGDFAVLLQSRNCYFSGNWEKRLGNCIIPPKTVSFTNELRWILSSTLCQGAILKRYIFTDHSDCNRKFVLWFLDTFSCSSFLIDLEWRLKTFFSTQSTKQHYSFKIYPEQTLSKIFIPTYFLQLWSKLLKRT